MMRLPFSQSVAVWIGRQLRDVMPHRKTHWVAAMLAEAESIADPNEALEFVFGCLWACIMERIREMEFQQKVVRSLLLAGLTSLGALAAWMSIGVSRVHEPAGLVFVALAVTYVAGALIAYFLGSRALAFGAGGLLAMAILSSAALNSSWISGTSLVNIELYRALAAEATLIWGSVVAGSLYLLHLARRGSVGTD